MAWVLRQDLEPASPVVVLVDAISVSGGGAQNLQPQVCLLPLGLPEMLGHPLPISFRPFPGWQKNTGSQTRLLQELKVPCLPPCLVFRVVHWCPLVAMTGQCRLMAA